jgi:hypothetical protein
LTSLFLTEIVRSIKTGEGFRGTRGGWPPSQPPTNQTMSEPVMEGSTILEFKP